MDGEARLEEWESIIGHISVPCIPKKIGIDFL